MGELGFGIPGSVRLRDHREADTITADERAEWLIDYILSHPGEERSAKLALLPLKPEELALFGPLGGEFKRQPR